MGLISKYIESYRKAKRLRQLGCYDTNKSKLISVSFENGIPSVGVPYYFKADLSLDAKNCVITQIAWVTSTELLNVQTSSGNWAGDALSTSVGMNALFVAVDSNQHIICQIPISCLASPLDGERPTFFWLDTHIWSNCYLLFDSVSGITTSNGLNFRVSYLEREVSLTL